MTTGISAADRALTIQVAMRADAGPKDLARPGHMFPLKARDGGVLVRAGQTEAAVDLARLAGLLYALVVGVLERLAYRRRHRKIQIDALGRDRACEPLRVDLLDFAGFHHRAERAVDQRAAAAAQSIAKALIEGAAARGALGEEITAERLELDADPAALQEFFFAHGWSDGLPVTPPTQEADSVSVTLRFTGEAKFRVLEGGHACLGEPSER